MHPTRRLTVLLLCAAAGLCGCKKDPDTYLTSPAADTKPATPPDDHVVALVNTTPLTWGSMEKRAMGYLKDDVETNHLVIPSNRLEEAKEHFRRRAIQAFVFKTLMLDEAVRQNIRLNPADRQQALRSLEQTLKSRNWTTDDFFNKGPMDEPTMRREFEDGMLIDKLLRVSVRTKIQLDDKELAQYEEALTKTNALKRAQLEGIRKQLLDGADFEAVARKVSEDASAASGGDLGEFGRGKMVKPFEDAAFSQAVGEIGPVVETRFGYHLIKVTAHTPARAATATTPAVPETVRASHILIKSVPTDRKRLSDSLQKAKFNNAVQTFYSELKAKAKIECLLYKDMTF